jgi:ABC-type branched-subunit amino acid transport system substrate-binding protein
MGHYRRGSLEIEDALSQIIRSGAEAVVMIGTYEPCAAFIRLARARHFNPIFHCVSFVGPEELVNRVGPLGDGVIITQVVPPPSAILLLPAAEEYSRLLGRFYPEDKPNYVGFEGFLNAKILVEGLRRAGPIPDREKFIDAIETIQNFSLGIGNPVTFGPQDHQGLDKVYFTQIHAGELALVMNLKKGTGQ